MGSAALTPNGGDSNDHSSRPSLPAWPRKIRIVKSGAAATTSRLKATRLALIQPPSLNACAEVDIMGSRQPGQRPIDPKASIALS